MAEIQSVGGVTTEVKEQEFVMERIYDAPRELVFKMFTQPEHVARWWAPTPYTIPVCKIDLRPGGLWHYCMQSPEGERHWAKAIYLEIAEPEMFSYTCTFADEDANYIEGIPEHKATLTFIEKEGKTKVSIHIQLASAEDLKTTITMGMAEGLTMALNSLSGLLSEIQS
jgi:uncharacterized protein YndB with AHSA1/START domain